MGFHRLAINGLNIQSNQPLNIRNISLICNGEIYNYKELYSILKVKPTTDSDCEIIIHMYLRYGIKQTLQLLDGVFAFVLYDELCNEVYVARDPYGVRPLYMSTIVNMDEFYNTYCFSSEMKMISKGKINSFIPGSYICLKRTPHWEYISQDTYVQFPSIQHFINDERLMNIQLRQAFENSVKKRVQVTDRPIACLLSGGLDSSLVTAVVCKYTDPTKLKTFSIGLPGSEDLMYAERVAAFLKTDHTSIVLQEDDFFNAIPEVIKAIESYDTTTVRASVGNYLVAKYIKEHTDCKVIFSGDGADELMGGYLYFHACPNEIEFDKECKHLLKNIYQFDVLRGDRTISSNGLEPRLPFLDRGFVQFYLSIPMAFRCHTLKSNCEKYLIRNAYASTHILPDEVLWRRKEAFSDGVSQQKRSWYKIIEEKIPGLVCDEYEKYKSMSQTDKVYMHNAPQTCEQYYYRKIFNQYYTLDGADKTIPYFWMPKYVDATDASARSLSIYDSLHK